MFLQCTYFITSYIVHIYVIFMILTMFEFLQFLEERNILIPAT